MLRELHISNLAIIEKVDIGLAPGLNVFTGQTGAGKSLILGALELLLGLRSGGEEAADFVRPGAAEARVSGLFEVASAALRRRLEEALDQPLPEGEPILVTRRVSSAGRSGATVNGSPVTAGMLRQASQLLVDIHGQHDQQFLLKPANQLQILDAFADATSQREEFVAVLSGLRQRQARLAELKETQEKRAEALELYRFQADEIDKARPRPGEYEQVKARYGVLKNAAHLKRQSSHALAALAEGDDTVLERLGTLRRCVQELLRMDGSLAEAEGQLEQAEGALREAADGLSRYQDRLRVDGEELARVEERLDVLNRLIHKYGKGAPAGGDAVEAVLAHRRDIGGKIAGLSDDAEALGGLAKEIEQLSKDVARIGEGLSRTRRAAAKKLKGLVESQFRELEMHEACFEVDLRTRGPSDPAVDSSGLDEMDFLVRTNPGQEMLPLRRIASGGEMSRIMLALKTILADKDQVSVMVFDEIDANIGDRLGATIGRKMRALAHGRPAGANRKRGQDRKGGQEPFSTSDTCHQIPSPRGQVKKVPDPFFSDPFSSHQILCITHLSQIAACADHHLQISKAVVGPDKDRQTVARVRVLEGEARARELAEMTAGRNVSAAALEHAHNLLRSAQGERVAAATAAGV